MGDHKNTVLLDSEDFMEDVPDDEDPTIRAVTPPFFYLPNYSAFSPGFVV